MFDSLSPYVSFDVSRTLLWIVLLPLLGALINGVAGRRASKGLVSAVAVGSVFTAFLLSLIGFGYLLSAGGPDDELSATVYEWFHIEVRGVDVPVRVRFVMDHLSGIMTVMVTGIASLIHIYSTGYMGDDPGYVRFMTYLNLFTASMLILVLASNLPLMFVGWEGVGLCSYLLIGFWYENKEYAAAGRKAFVVNRIGDFGVLIAMFLFVSVVADARTPDAFEFSQINAAATRLGLVEVHLMPVDVFPWLHVSVATAAALFLFLGCAGKSAQIPLYVWLPDAMAGPTPVSALIHAATMVTAGVYLCVRLSPVIVESPFAMTVIAVVGALTAVLAASIALVQNQMKKVLAYSTVSQLGFMFAAVGSGAFAAGFFHVFTHAFFKACLFLGAGAVMHSVHAHGDADIRYLGGLKKYLPKTHVTFLISTAAIAGLPLLSGFFSKDEILLGAATWGAASPYAPWVGWLVFGLLVVTATMTAFYMFRLYFRTFHGEFKGGHAPDDAHAHEDHAHGDGHAHDDHAHDAPHESPDSMTIPLLILAGGAAIVGVLGLPHALHLPNWWGGWLTPQNERFLETLHDAPAGTGHEDAAAAATAAAQQVPSSVAVLEFDGQIVHAPSWVAFAAMGFGVLAFLIGAGLAWLWYAKQDGAPARALRERFVGVHKFLMNKWYIDELYGATVVGFSKWVGVFAANVDRFFVDGLLTRVTAVFAKAAGYAVTRTQTGVLYAYAALFVVGLAALGWWYSYPHPGLTGESESAGTVAWSAGRGLGYEYRWDFDSDDTWDTEWIAEATQNHVYEAGAAYDALVLVIESPRDAFGPQEIVVEQGGGPVVLHSVAGLGADWVRTDPETHLPVGDAPPSAAWDRGALALRINDAAIDDRDGEDDGRMVLRPGDMFRVGDGRLTVAVRMRGTVQVRNAFGNLATSSEEVTLPIPRQPTALAARAGQEHGR